MLYLFISFTSARLAYNAMIERPHDKDFQFDGAFLSSGQYPHVLRFKLNDSNALILDNVDIRRLAYWADPMFYKWCLRSWAAKS